MRISPLDIRKQPFRRTLMGMDPDEVNSFLEMVASEFESLIKQDNELSTQARVTTEKLEGYTKIERTLNETLLTAQKITDESRLNAQREAELILKDAQIRADAYEDESRRRVHRLETDLITLKNQRDSFLLRFRAMLEAQLELLKVISDDLKKDGGGSPRRSQDKRHDDETLAEVPPQPNLASEDLVG